MCARKDFCFKETRDAKWRLAEYLRNSFYDERMHGTREQWLCERIPKTSPQFLYPLPCPPAQRKGGDTK